VRRDDFRTWLIRARLKPEGTALRRLLNEADRNGDTWRKALPVYAVVSSLNLPTPWIGLWERIDITVFLLWIVMLAAVLGATPGRDAEGEEGPSLSQERRETR
jgi:hypothetical protein